MLFRENPDVSAEHIASIFGVVFFALKKKLVCSKKDQGFTNPATISFPQKIKSRNYKHT
jgi:hypothetical protein